MKAKLNIEACFHARGDWARGQGGGGAQARMLANGMVLTRALPLLYVKNSAGGSDNARMTQDFTTQTMTLAAGAGMCSLSQLLGACDALMQPQSFHDYAPNGLQVQGKPDVQRLVCGVTASRALIEAAIAAGADALLVHHGLFWRGQSQCVTGWMRERLRLLLTHDISLLAYHLPLDAHPELGNNAQLAVRLGLEVQGNFGEHDLGFIGQRAGGGAFASAAALHTMLERELQHSVLCVDGSGGAPLERIAWCSGGAQGWLQAAIDAGAQAFITGEASEPQPHLARECGVAFFACGHHATERYGVQALAQRVAGQFGIACQFVDINNPA